MPSWHVALAGLALLCIPGVQAGLRINAVEVEDEPLVPDLAGPALVVVGDVDCTSALLRAQGTGGVNLRTGWTGQNLVISGTGDHHLETSDCGAATTIPVRIPLGAAVLRAAPAMEPQAGSVWLAFAPSELDGSDPANDTADFALRARPLVVPLATFPVRQAVQDGQPVVFNVDVRNLGNVAFEVTGGGTIAGVVGPDPGITTTVEVSTARVERDGNGTVVVSVGVLAGDWTTAHALGKLTVRSLVEPAGEPRVVPFDFLLTQKPVERRDAPPAPLPLALVAVGLLVAGRRR